MVQCLHPFPSPFTTACLAEDQHQTALTPANTLSLSLFSVFLPLLFAQKPCGCQEVAEAPRASDWSGDVGEVEVVESQFAVARCRAGAVRLQLYLCDVNLFMKAAGRPVLLAVLHGTVEAGGISQAALTYPLPS